MILRLSGSALNNIHESFSLRYYRIISLLVFKLLEFQCLSNFGKIEIKITGLKKMSKNR